MTTRTCAPHRYYTEPETRPGGTTFTVSFVLYDVHTGPSTLYLGLSPLPAAGTDWTLYVGDQAFALTDATRVGNQLEWASADLTLAVGSTVSLTLRDGSDTGGSDSRCAARIDQGETSAARWDARCLSVSNPGPHAAYYVYTPESTEITRVTLTSPDAGEGMYLWENDGRVNRQVREAGSAGYKSAEMWWWARAGRTYVLEVTASRPSAGGRYLLAMHNGGGITEAPSVASGCREDLGTTDSGSTFAGGVLEWPCHSVDRPGSYARYYTFTTAQARDVRLEIAGSELAGASMTLRSGTNGSGPNVIESHFPGIGPVRARIDKEDLPAGTYTVEVVASGPGHGGHLSLVLKDMPPKWTPAAHCVTDLGNVTYVGTQGESVTGEWSSGGCASYSHTSNYARFYRFTLTETVKLAFNLSSDAGTRLYLFAGASFRNPINGELGDESFLERNLAPGTYTIEVTTNNYGADWQTGSYTLTYRRTGPEPPPPAADPGAPTTGTIWTATLTVQAEDYPEDFLGCFGKGSCRSALSSPTFAFGDAWYTIRAVGVNQSGNFSFQIDGNLSPKWTLHVDDQQFTLSNSGAWGWGPSYHSFSWSAGDEVTLNLVKNP